MKMKKLIKFISFILVACVLVVGMSCFMSTTSDRDTMHIKGYFKEPKNTVDVLLIGASELYTGFNSPLAWSEFGFTSYSICFAAQPGNLCAVMLSKALETQSPKLTAIEINGFLRHNSPEQQYGKIHTWFDNVGIDDGGKEYIEKNVPQEMRNEYRFPFYKYHSNWKTPSVCIKNFFCRLFLAAEGVNYTKSFANTNLTRKDGEIKEYKSNFNDESRQALTDTLELCKSRGLKQVVFFRTPHCLKNTNPQDFEKIKKLVESYGYTYANFESSLAEIGLNAKNDFYNPDHLNIYGMEKNTRFLAKYFTENFDVKSSHSDETVKQWNRCAELTAEISEECKNDKKHHIYYELSAYENAVNIPHSISFISTIDDKKNTK